MKEIFLLKHEGDGISCYYVVGGKLYFEKTLKDMDEVIAEYPTEKFFGIFIYPIGVKVPEISLL